jgi:hypothetical protein
MAGGEIPAIFRFRNTIPQDTAAAARFPNLFKDFISALWTAPKNAIA